MSQPAEHRVDLRGLAQTHVIRQDGASSGSLRLGPGGSGQELRASGLEVVQLVVVARTTHSGELVSQGQGWLDPTVELRPRPRGQLGSVDQCLTKPGT
jgi:hypothetical protein